MAAKKGRAPRGGARDGATRVAGASADSLPALLIDVLADYYWEQDAEYRFTVWRATRPADSSLPAEAVLGKTSAELCAAPAGDLEHWVRHRRTVEAREPFRDVVHTVAPRNAPTFHLSLSGAPRYTSNGDFVGYQGVARESGALVRMERLLALEGMLLRGLAEADDLASALPLIFGPISAFAGFGGASYFRIDEVARVLRRVAAHGEARAGALADGAEPPPWLQADPVWLAEPGEPRDAAWRSTLVVPVVACGSTIGALEFCVADRTAPDAGLLRTLRGVAAQLGHLHVRAAAAERLRESEDRFASTMALAAIGISHVDDAGRFLYVNPQLCAMLGYSERELLARTVRDISYPDDVDATLEPSNQLRQGLIGSFKAEKRYLRKDGSIVWAGLTVAMKRDRDGRKLYDVSIVEDISARKEAEARIQYLASHDGLTGLPNRARFTQLLGGASEAARRERRRLAVLFVDLDRFKIINDSLGHEAGDEMLRAAAARLRGSVRSGDVVARLGGDEFVVLLHDVGEAAAAGKVAANLLETLAEPVSIKGHDCRVSASIGICLHPDGDQEDQAVLRNADMAMYLAKQSGKNGYRLYVNELSALSAERAALAAQVRDALETDACSVVFDARVTASMGAVRAIEARMRFTNAELAAVGHARVAAAAEGEGLLVPINRRVLHAACEASAAWQRAGLRPTAIGVSAAAGQITDHGFAAEVQEALRAAGVAPGLLELRVTEDVLLFDCARSTRTLLELHALGVRLVVEAFGSGKASFADLKRFPIHAVKLHADRADGVARDLEKQRYVEGVVALGRALKLEVIAAGVANREDADFLRAAGCAALQGPIAPEGLAATECEALLREHR